ncbi:ArsR/SmtB family transcription factor [Amycolatopsis jiangsuensis]|uniref:DNA-binding transcriptional ArsR family regulator n=1 Tax=Amycolatopsis jiangsuensis TaxID=1181879 RepID=A0A840J6T8_9PSEU|nr:winged helix-turn-helix domain-containing protein [Amycolatopsis jiangsuensis]MBB4689740.1 DNA-binding transcriptional ArsR family regulator [Amycolatopsis jiangsuensis]
MPGEDTPAQDAVHIRTTEQLRAVNNVVRHRVLAALRDGPATITQLAERLGLAKGSSSYHVRVLERAGLIHVVRTRKVRGVVERYYAHVGRRIVLPEPVAGQRDVLMQHALADLATAPEGTPRYVRMQHTRIGEAQFAEFERRLGELLDDLRDARDPDAPAATAAVAFFRPGKGAAE